MVCDGCTGRGSGVVAECTAVDGGFLEEGSKGSEGSSSQGDGGFDERPFHEINAVPGVVCCVLELINVVDTHESCGARTVIC